MSDMEKQLREVFLEDLKRECEDTIQDSWNNYYGYVRNLNALNIQYSWQRFNETRVIYEKWKSNLD